MKKMKIWNMMFIMAILLPLMTSCSKDSDDSAFVVTVSVRGDIMKWNGTASNGVRFNYSFVRE